MCARLHAAGGGMLVQRLEDNFELSVLSHVGPRNQTWVLRPDGQCLYLLSTFLAVKFAIKDRKCR